MYISLHEATVNGSQQMQSLPGVLGNVVQVVRMLTLCMQSSQSQQSIHAIQQCHWT